MNPVKRKVMEVEVKYLVENGFAVPSFSACSSPCLLVPKSNGTQRFCTDYRRVNAVTKPDSFPLPLMEDCIDNVGFCALRHGTHHAEGVLASSLDGAHGQNICVRYPG